MSLDDLSNFSMDELFRAEAEGQCISLSNDLLALEKTTQPAPMLERLMRAAHSLKGAARIVGKDEAVRVAHSMEEIFVKAQKTLIVPPAGTIDLLLRGVDYLSQLAGVTPGTPSREDVDEFVRLCLAPPEAVPASEAGEAPASAASAPAAPESAERRDVRMDSERLDQLLGLAGQAVVASRVDPGNLQPVRVSLRQIQNLLADLSTTTDETRRASIVRQASAAASYSQSELAELSERRDLQSRRLSQLCGRVYHEALACRLRPFGDIIPGLRRLARDLARDLGKDVDVEISGEGTEVDRDLLDRLDGPLAHLIRNSLDHGLETPTERLAAGKNRTGRLQISARHQAGWLVVAVSDDGRGLNGDAIRDAVRRRGLAAEEHLAQMNEAELSDFLLLPGFSLSKTVTEISGRGVGLDAVRAMAFGAGGSLRLSRGDEGGFSCEMILPVSLSLVRALLVDIAGECFALPLTRVERVMEATKEEVQAVGGRQHIFLGAERVELVDAAQVLELGSGHSAEGIFPIVVLQGAQSKIGLVVDRFRGMRELSLQRLDSRLGRVQDVSATALLDNGDPVAVLDVNDLAITAANVSAGSRYKPVLSERAGRHAPLRRVLVADDSLTVRELERKLLAGRGYAVETAIDGVDAWNALRQGAFDLLVTDIDMPRLDGIELVRLVRNDVRLRDLPVIVVSYKDREEDRVRGLEAGADFYLPKSSYQDESLIKAVLELIGEPQVS